MATTRVWPAPTRTAARRRTSTGSSTRSRTSSTAMRPGVRPPRHRPAAPVQGAGDLSHELEHDVRSEPAHRERHPDLGRRPRCPVASRSSRTAAAIAAAPTSVLDRPVDHPGHPVREHQLPGRRHGPQPVRLGLGDAPVPRPDGRVLPLTTEQFFEGGWNYDALIAANPTILDVKWNQPDQFQAPRQIRLSVKFQF